MILRRRRTIACLTAGLVASSLPGAAMAADPLHVRGVVSAVDGPAVTVKDKDGKIFHLTLGNDWRISGVVPATLADVKQGTFIGTANVDDGAGNTALEVVVFPEAMRGTGEGDRGWDLKPKSSMTNATVETEVEGVDGRTVTLSYKGGTKKVVIPPATPIVSIGAATKDDLTVGAKVFVAGDVAADGTTLSKGFIAVGKNGLVPPM